MENNLNDYQIKIYYNLMMIWLKYPELRFGQLVSNLQTKYSTQNGKTLHIDESHIDPFYLEDKDFAEFLDDFVEDNL